MLSLLLTCVYVVNFPVPSQYIHTQAMACLSMKTEHAISEVVHGLCSMNSANKRVEAVIPSSDFWQPPFPISFLLK